MTNTWCVDARLRLPRATRDININVMVIVTTVYLHRYLQASENHRWGEYCTYVDKIDPQVYLVGQAFPSHGKLPR